MSDRAVPVPKTVLLKHHRFGYFTGQGWSAEKTDARKMSSEGAASWMKLFKDMAPEEEQHRYNHRAYDTEIDL